MSAALWVVLTAAGDAPPRVFTLEPATRGAAAAKQAADAAFDEVPPPPRVNEDVRVKAFAGALAGGLVGFGAMMAISVRM